jgi:DNA polymerase
MLIGEAPGEQEDHQGEPFVGPAGQLLDEMLLAVGLTREQVYIANIIKCRPPGNRDPSSAESAQCRQWLECQIDRVSPRVIMAVGGVAAKNLLGTDEPMWKLRGRVHRYRGIALVAGYHPAYLLRSPGEKRKAWQDLRLVMQVLESER